MGQTDSAEISQEFLQLRTDLERAGIKQFLSCKDIGFKFQFLVSYDETLPPTYFYQYIKYPLYLSGKSFPASSDDHNTEFLMKIPFVGDFEIETKAGVKCSEKAVS